MAVVSYGASTELDAVNSILMSVGESPVNTLTVQSPEVAIAQKTLRQVCREVLSEGWVFNTEYEYPITLDANKHCIVPNNVLQIDLSASNASDKHVVRRGGKLYDKEHHTYEWTDGAVDCDITWLFDWVDLPRPIQDYITARASVITSSRIVGDQGQYQMLQQKEAYMRAMALEYECNQGDYSFFGKPDGAEPYVSYEPYKALMR